MKEEITKKFIELENKIAKQDEKIFSFERAIWILEHPAKFKPLQKAELKHLNGETEIVTILMEDRILYDYHDIWHFELGKEFRRSYYVLDKNNQKGYISDDKYLFEIKEKEINVQS